MTITRVGNGFDIHAFDAADADDVASASVLRLAGVDIPEGRALAGHSDADVAAHAVTDALLGALALGDLGTRFGTDEPQIAGINSLQLLAAVVADVAGAGWRLGNLDVTIVAQHPRLAAYRDAMRASLAAACALDIDEVSVKLTTTDRLGAIGRQEGIAAWATCVVTREHR